MFNETTDTDTARKPKHKYLCVPEQQVHRTNNMPVAEASNHTELRYISVGSTP